MELMIHTGSLRTAYVIQNVQVCLRCIAFLGPVGLWNVLEGWACGEEGTV